MALRKNCIAVFFLLMVVSVAFAHGPKAKGGKAKAAKAEAPAPEESAAEATEGPTEAPEGATDAAGGKGVIDVTKLGASGNGKTDSTKAFMEAWKKACTAGQHKILVPKGDYLVGPLEFTGPCKGAKITISLEGNLLGTTDLSKYNKNWIEVSYVDDFSLIGPGKIDGQGAAVWNNNKCHKSYNCKILPNSLVFNFVNNGTVSGVKLVNSKFFHMNIFQCKGFMVDGVTVNSPEDSPNTDGIHIGDSSSINITDTVIGTGDDCISIGPGNKDITITGVTCGPGHGISVGSLGRYKDEKDVTGVTVRNCVLKGTTNGIRIKSYEDSPTALTASQFTYENIKMDDVQNPIIIDQKYCPNNICTQHGNSKVTIKDVTFRNITGTSATAAAVSLLCTDKLPCDGVHLVDVNVKYTGTDNKTQAVCSNAHGSCKGTLEALACL